MKGPKRVDLTPEQIDSLMSRLNDQNLQPDDYPLLADLIRSLVWMQTALQEKKLSIARLRKVFGIKTESAKQLLKMVGQGNSQDGGDEQDDQSEDIPSNKDAEESPRKKKLKGHGRRPASNYKEAKIIGIAHETFKKGDRCPLCGTGKLYNLSPGTVLRIVGQPWLDIEIFKPERLRCNKCQHIFTAKLPQEVVTQSRARVF